MRPLLTARQTRTIGALQQADKEMSAYREYVCVVCGFVYNEAEGLPEEGLAPGTRWEDVPDTWVCPECGATKDEFELVEI